MATVVHQCPHDGCLTERMNFEALFVSSMPVPGGYQKVRNFIQTSCKACGQPVAFELADDTGRGQLSPNLSGYPLSLEQMGWKVVRVWPEPPKARVPDDLPGHVARAFLSAERNFPFSGMEEASVAMYGRALELGTIEYAPDLSSRMKLHARIKELATQHRITQDLADWADQIRFIRNDAMHGVDDITRDELIATRGFTEMVLTYLFTLPAMLKAKQAAAGSATPP